jgi:hypothetical protein
MSKISGHFGAFRQVTRPFTLQFQWAADNSLFRIEQGIPSPRTGNFFATIGNFLRDNSVSKHRLDEAGNASSLSSANAFFDDVDLPLCCLPDLIGGLTEAI